MEGWRSLAWVVDDEVVDVIVVYYVRNISSRLLLRPLAAQKTLRAVLAVIVAHCLAPLLKAPLLVLKANSHIVITFGHRVFNNPVLTLWLVRLLSVFPGLLGAVALLGLGLLFQHDIVVKVAFRDLQNFCGVLRLNFCDFLELRLSSAEDLSIGFLLVKDVVDVSLLILPALEVPVILAPKALGLSVNFVVRTLRLGALLLLD